MPDALLLHSQDTWLNRQVCLVYRQYEAGNLSGHPHCWSEETPSHATQVHPRDHDKKVPLCTGHRRQFESAGAQRFAVRYFGTYDELMAAAEGYLLAYRKTLRVPGVGLVH